MIRKRRLGPSAPTQKSGSPGGKGKERGAGLRKDYYRGPYKAIVTCPNTSKRKTLYLDVQEKGKTKWTLAGKPPAPRVAGKTKLEKEGGANRAHDLEKKTGRSGAG